MADVSSLIELPLPEFDPYELDPSEHPRWNVLARMWPLIQSTLLTANFDAYELTTEREEFHSLPYVSRWFGTLLVSPYLKKPVETIDEFVAHCRVQAEKWHREDARLNRGKAFLKSKKGPSSELEKARAEWKQAVQKRKDLMREMDEEVRRLHARFVQLRDGGLTPVA